MVGFSPTHKGELIMKYGCIYRIYKISNQKSYIGKTARNIKDRIREHFRSNLKIGIDSAIQKYGSNNFGWEILYDNIPEWMLSDLEIRTIASLNTYKGFGYNLTIGGEGFPCGEDHPTYGKEPWNKNKPWSEEVKEKLRGPRPNARGPRPHLQGKNSPLYGKTGKDHPNYGRRGQVAWNKNKSLSEDHKEKLRGPRPSLQGKNHPMYGRTGKSNPMYGKGYLVSGENNGMYNKNHSIETRKEISRRVKEEFHKRRLEQDKKSGQINLLEDNKL